MSAKRSDVGKDAGIRLLLENAENFIERGVEELEEGVKPSNAVKIRDAAEKLWNVVVSATNALILYYLDVAPTSHWERWKILEKLEETDPGAEELGFRDRYGARERCLHMMTFYDGAIDLDMLRREVDKVKKHVSDVKNLVVRSAGQNLGLQVIGLR